MSVGDVRPSTWLWALVFAAAAVAYLLIGPGGSEPAATPAGPLEVVVVTTVVTTGSVPAGPGPTATTAAPGGGGPAATATTATATTGR